MACELRLGKERGNRGRGIHKGSVEGFSEISGGLAARETLPHLIAGKAARRAHGGVVVQLSKEVHAALYRPGELYSVRYLRVNDHVIGRRNVALFTGLEVHKPHAACKHVEDAPTSCRQRVFLLQGCRDGIFRERE